MLITLQVFCFFIFLGLQDLLCVWFYATGVHHIISSDHMCNDSVYIFLIECWRLSMVSHILYIFMMDIVLCFYAAVGNGQVCVQLVRLEFTCISTHFITSFLKQSMSCDYWVIIIIMCTCCNILAYIYLYSSLLFMYVYHLQNVWIFSNNFLLQLHGII